MRKSKVLVFMTFDFPVVTGTTVWAKNFLENMSRIPDVEFVVVFSGPASNQKFVDETLSCDYQFVPFRQSPIPGAGSGMTRRRRALSRALNILIEKYCFWNERLWHQQKHVNVEVAKIVRNESPDLIILGGISAAFCAPSIFSSGTPCCLITLNNEIAIYREIKSEGGRAGMSTMELWFYRRFNWVSNMRVVRHIKGVYRQCAGIVALTRNDLPAGMPSRVIQAVIPPVLNMSEARWSYRGMRCVLFVGSMFVGTMMHYPNRLSIEWICSRLAPELAAIDDKIRINIIGATADQVPGSWRHPNINFMGRAEERELIYQMTTADLFIAPIENNYGAKLKLAECVSRGMPFVASEGAMSGLPFLEFISRIDLNQPNAAARLVVGYLRKPEELVKLSEAIVTRAQQARAEQDRAWEAVLKGLIGKREIEHERSLQARSEAESPHAALRGAGSS